MMRCPLCIVRSAACAGSQLMRATSASASRLRRLLARPPLLLLALAETRLPARAASRRPSSPRRRARALRRRRRLERRRLDARRRRVAVAARGHPCRPSLKLLARTRRRRIPSTTISRETLFITSLNASMQSTDDTSIMPLCEQKLMRVIQKALTFDDVLLLPAHSRVLPRDVSLKTRLTRNLELNIPLVSAAMDTVTEARLAIAIAQEGGIGIIHKNLHAAGAGRRGREGEALRVRRAARSDDHHAGDDGARGRSRCSSSTRSRASRWSKQRQGGRHRHQPRPALRDASSTSR